MKKETFKKLHYELWDRIAEYFDNGGGYLYDGLNTLKEDIIFQMEEEEKLNNLTTQERIVSECYGCFACGHARLHDDSSCRKCPLKWPGGHPTKKFDDPPMCENKESPYAFIFDDLYYRDDNHDWGKLAELARRVRDLPVIDEVFDD